MAVYNGERYLSEAIESILGQSFTDFEFIIVDDASTDGSAELLSRFADLDKRVRILRNAQNLGLTKSLNVGLRAVRGRYIARMDADDVAHPERLHWQVKFLENNPDYVLAAGAHLEIDGQGTVTKVQGRGRDDLEVRWMSLFWPPFIHGTATFRTDVVHLFGEYYDERYITAQDFDYWSRLSRHGRLVVLGSPVLKYRNHSGNVSAVKAKEQKTTHLEIALKHAKQRLGTARGEDADFVLLLQFLLGLRRGGWRTTATACRTMNRIVAIFAANEALAPAELARVRARAGAMLAGATLRRREIATIVDILTFAAFCWRLILALAASSIRRNRINVPLNF